MASGPDLAWQGSLFDTGEITYDASFGRCERRQLADGAWVDHQSGWLGGADEVFATLLAATPWGQHERWLYERKVTEPRLTHRWRLDAETDSEGPPTVLEDIASALSARYGVEFTQVGVNLYRDGSDSVAWGPPGHGRQLPGHLGSRRPEGGRIRPADQHSAPACLSTLMPRVGWSEVVD